MYVKLFDDLLDSTIWMEKDHIVRVWLTLLLLSNSEGFVEMPIPAIASRARVGLDECAEAIARLEAPDPYSRTGIEEGRRIIRITKEKTLWKIVNFEYYRALRSADQKREYQKRYMREYRERKKKALQSESSGEESSQGETKSHGLAQAEAEAEAETDPSIDHPLRDDRASAIPFEDFWKLYPRKVSKKKARVAWVNLTIEKQKKAMATLPRHLQLWAGKNKNFIPHPTTWLNQERWDDEIEGGKLTPDDPGYYDDPWVVGTYRREDMHNHGNHSRWDEYTKAAADWDPETAPTFKDWLEANE